MGINGEDAIIQGDGLAEGGKRPGQIGEAGGAGLAQLVAQGSVSGTGVANQAGRGIRRGYQTR